MIGKIKLKIFILILITFGIFNCAFGEIIVINKLTKQPSLTVPHRFVSVGSNSSAKFQIVVSEPVNACTSVDLDPPDQSHLYSVQGGIAEKSWVLLANEFDCTFQQKIRNADLKGYQGIIIYANDRDAFSKNVKSNLMPDTEILISIISVSDATELKKYANNRFVVKIERDWGVVEILEDLNQFLSCTSKQLKIFSKRVSKTSRKLSAKFIKAVPLILQFMVQILIFIAPVSVFILLSKITGISWFANSEHRGSYQQYCADEDSEPENNNTNYSFGTDNERLLQKYRDLLDVRPNDTKATIESNFRRRVRQYHPDKNIHKSEREKIATEEIFKEYLAAKTALLKEVEIRTKYE